MPADRFWILPEIIDQRRIDENDPTALEVVRQRSCKHEGYKPPIGADNHNRPGPDHPRQGVVDPPKSQVRVLDSLEVSHPRKIGILQQSCRPGAHVSRRGVHLREGFETARPLTTAQAW